MQGQQSTNPKTAPDTAPDTHVLLPPQKKRVVALFSPQAGIQLSCMEKAEPADLTKLKGPPGQLAQAQKKRSLGRGKGSSAKRVLRRSHEYGIVRKTFRSFQLATSDNCRPFIFRILLLLITGTNSPQLCRNKIGPRANGHPELGPRLSSETIRYRSTEPKAGRTS